MNKLLILSLISMSITGCVNIDDQEKARSLDGKVFCSLQKQAYVANYQAGAEVWMQRNSEMDQLCRSTSTERSKP